MGRYTTRQVAKKLRLSLMTVQRYIAAGKIPAPPLQGVGPGSVRVWTDDDIKKVRRILPKLINGRKSRYKKAVNSSQLSVVSKGKKKKKGLKPRAKD